jgi:hypothetical protein
LISNFESHAPQSWCVEADEELISDTYGTMTTDDLVCDFYGPMIGLV